MSTLPASMKQHRIQASDPSSVLLGSVRYAPAKSLWFTGMASVAVVGGAATLSWSALLVFLATTGAVLLMGHSLGSHRKLIHDSFECPRWLERLLVWMGVQVGLAGPIGLLRQHELRDYAQRLPDCHPYLRHGGGFWKDAWWQLHCDLDLRQPPALHLEARIANDLFYRWLERTWMLQQLPPALLLYAAGGWAFVVWGVCARITAGVFGHWLIGYFAHNHGGMHYAVDGAAVQGRNIRWTSLLTMGECWHNNHHAYPGSARLGLAPGEWDPGWWALMLLTRVGLVRRCRLPTDLPPRPELRQLHLMPVVDEPSRPSSVVWLWQRARARDELALVSPGVHLRQATLQRLTSRQVAVTMQPASARLQARCADRLVTGLPALWLAVARRSASLRWSVACLLPAAVGVEVVRGWMTSRPI